MSSANALLFATDGELVQLVRDEADEFASLDDAERWLIWDRLRHVPDDDRTLLQRLRSVLMSDLRDYVSDIDEPGPHEILAYAETIASIDDFLYKFS